PAEKRETTEIRIACILGAIYRCASRQVRGVTVPRDGRDVGEAPRDIVAAIRIELDPSARLGLPSETPVSSKGGRAKIDGARDATNPVNCRRAMKPSLLFLAAVLLAAASSACTHVAPYQREILAHPTMTPDDVATGMDAHVRAVSEGASGGLGGGGGGCG